MLAMLSLSVSMSVVACSENTNQSTVENSTNVDVDKEVLIEESDADKEDVGEETVELKENHENEHRISNRCTIIYSKRR